MAQDILLKNQVWDDVPAVNLPIDGGGMQRFTDVSNTTAVPSDVASGKIFFNSSGIQQTGTSSGGGANLQTKSVTYTPTTSQQTDTVSPDTGYDGLSLVNVIIEAMQSGVEMPTFTLSGIQEGSTVTCDKTYAEARTFYSNGMKVAVASTTGYGNLPVLVYEAGSDYLLYVAYYTDGTPLGDIRFTSSTITYTIDSTIIKEPRLPVAIKSTVTDHAMKVRVGVNYIKGFYDGGQVYGDPVYVSASEVVSGTKSISANGTGIDVTNYASVDVSVPSGQPNLQAKTYTVDSAGTETITADSGYDGLSSVSVSVPQADPWVAYDYGYTGSGSNLKWQANALVEITVDAGDTEGWLPDGYNKSSETVVFNAIPSNTTVTPTESAQTIGGENTMMEGAVTVSAIPSNYVGTGVTRRDDDDLSGVVDDPYYVVSAPSGYYPSSAEFTLPLMTLPSSASSSYSGTRKANILPSTSQRYLTIPSGYNPTAQFYQIIGAELLPLNITQNGTYDPATYDVFGFGTVTVDVPSGGSSTCATTTMTNSDNQATSIQFTNLSGEPKWFFMRCTSQLTRSSSYSYYFVTDIRYNGTNHNGNYYRRSNGTFYNDTSHYSHTYSNGTLTVSSSASRGAAGGSFYNGTYELVYIY